MWRLSRSRSDQIWDRWAELSKGNAMSFLLRGPRQAAKEKLGGGRRPRDRHLSQQRCPDGLRERLGARPQPAAACAFHGTDDKTVRASCASPKAIWRGSTAAAKKSAAILNDAVEKFGRRSSGCRVPPIQLSDWRAPMWHCGTWIGRRRRLPGGNERVSVGKSRALQLADVTASGPTGRSGIRAKCGGCRRRKCK